MDRGEDKRKRKEKCLTKVETMTSTERGGTYSGKKRTERRGRESRVYIYSPSPPPPETFNDHGTAQGRKSFTHNQQHTYIV